MKNSFGFLFIFFCVFIVSLVFKSCHPGAEGAPQSHPFKDAVKVWHFESAAPAIGSAEWTAEGNVSFGVKLDGAEREASLARGGNGTAIRIGRGGFLRLADESFTLHPNAFTVALRIRDPEGRWDFPILGDAGNDTLVSFSLRTIDAHEKPQRSRDLNGRERPTVESWFVAPNGPRTVPRHSSLLEAVWGAKEPNSPRIQRILDRHPEAIRPNPLSEDIINGVMRVNYPVSLLGPHDWHDVVLRFTGPKFQLFVDGVLLDEEYPIGETRPRTLPFLLGATIENGEIRSGFDGLIDYLAVWDRALDDAEIITLSGGSEAVAARELAILGPETKKFQYFRARGHNRKVGDAIPYWDEKQQTFRLFYLILRRNHHSKWDGGHGGLEIWQASTKDLKTWEHHPVVIPIAEQWEAYHGTGAVAYLDGKYHFFYPTPDYDGSRGGIQHAVSSDGIHFVRQEPHPVLDGGDCEVFQVQGDDKTFHMVKVGTQKRASVANLTDKTLVAWVRLADLKQRGGSVLAIELPGGALFDGLVLGKSVEPRWMPGSSKGQSTPLPNEQLKWPAETAGQDEIIQIAMTHQGRQVTIYRNGEPYGLYEKKEPAVFNGPVSLLIGGRHMGTGTTDHAFFRGCVLDARLYDRALSMNEIAALKRSETGGPDPLAWYDFDGGLLSDRTGNFPDLHLFGNARIDDGALVLGESGDYAMASGVVRTQMRLTSTDLINWVPVKGSFIESNKSLIICPNVFRFGDWHYYFCGSGVWRSKEPFGPWEEYSSLNVTPSPLRLDNLSVPKTAAFGKDRRIYVGFLRDDGWGGNLVVRELVHDQTGQLGTRFVPEMIPASGEPLAIIFDPKPPKTEGRTVHVTVEQSICVPNIPGDYRLRMEIEAGTEALTSSFGIGLCESTADGSDGADLIFEPSLQRVSFSKTKKSSGIEGTFSNTRPIDYVEGMNQPFQVDIIVRHDIIDAEIGGFRTIANRFWNPRADRIRLFTNGGTVTFRDVRVEPLTDRYEPYPGWREAMKNDDPR